MNSGLKVIRKNTGAVVIKGMVRVIVSSVVASIIDATDRGASVINMSFGGGRLTYAELRALRYAFRHDVVLVVVKPF